MMDADGGAAQALRPRFYGRRAGRSLRPGRQALVAEHLPQVSVACPPSGALLDPRQLFPSLAEVWLEIGCGAGEHLSAHAVARRDVGFIACEPYINGVAALLARMHRLGLDDQVRVHADDARPFIACLSGASIDRVFVLFADPWPKRRHHRRRFVQPDSVHLIAHILKPGGEFLFASDHMDYIRWTIATALDHPELEWCAEDADDWRCPPADWAGTRYEQKALKRGGRCAYLRFRKVGGELYD